MLDEIYKILSKDFPLKAKEIAKQMNIPRKDVNSFLYQNLDHFVCDEEYRWAVKSAEYEVIFYGGWVDCNSFEKSLSEVGSPLEMNVSFVKFILPAKCCFLLDASSRFLALCNQLASRGVSVVIDFQDCMQTLHFFNRIGFIDQLVDDVSVLPSRPKESTAITYKGNSERVVEFGQIDPGKINKELANQLTDCFVGLAEQKYETAAFTIFSELIGNVKEHSHAPLPGFAALQAYKGKRHHIQTVVSDSGLGIAHTLRPSLQQHHRSLFKMFSAENLDSDIGLVKSAMSKGEISRYGEGRGLGFKSSREQAVKFDASFSVRQKYFSLEFIFERGKLIKVIEKRNLIKIEGTHICFDFQID